MLCAFTPSASHLLPLFFVGPTLQGLKLTPLKSKDLRKKGWGEGSPILPGSKMEPGDPTRLHAPHLPPRISAPLSRNKFHSRVNATHSKQSFEPVSTRYKNQLFDTADSPSRRSLSPRRPLTTPGHPPSHPRRFLSALCAVFAALFLVASVAHPARAQEAPPEIGALAHRLAPSLHKRVLVTDFEAPDARWLPFGAWLADEFSAALQSEHVQVASRSALTTALENQHLQRDGQWNEDVLKAVAKSIGAQTIVGGTFAAAQNGLALTLTGRDAPSDGQFVQVSGKVSISQALAEKLGVPVDSLRPKDGIYDTNQFGVGLAVCVRCPAPDFSAAAADGGMVILKAVVTAEGRTGEATVVRSAGAAMDEEALKAVKKWRFKPALDLDGRPVAARTFIQVTFNLLRGL
jgi:TonB family protein